jgi:hypothetical protein
MNASYVIHQDRRFVDEVVRGPVTRNELSAFFSSVFNDPQWDPTFDGVLDFTSATVEMGYMDVRDLVASFRTNPAAGRGRWACVVSNDAAYGMLRMYQTLSDGLHSDFMIFRERSAALAWIKGSAVLV